MRAYDFATPTTVAQAIVTAGADGAYLAGGTTLVDLLKLEATAPPLLVNIGRLPLAGIAVDDGGLHVGALERMSDVADHELVRTNFPVISEALLLSASPQIRNMATMGGNLLQRTRCGYFRDVSVTACNKRAPGSGCAALTGENRMHAVLGTSGSCAATHASDLAVALVALSTVLHLDGGDGQRDVDLESFYVLPGDRPDVENVLRPGEIITGFTVPALPWASRSTYVKVRDRQSYEFALASAALALNIESGTITEARVAAGGVGTRPWRLPGVEAALAGQPARESTYQAAVVHAADEATTLDHNAYKPELLRRTLLRALVSLGAS